MAQKTKKQSLAPLVRFDADREEKRKALSTAMKQIEKDFGEGSIMKLGANPRMEVQAVHTGSLSLDMALGIGGVEFNKKSLCGVGGGRFGVVGKGLWWELHEVNKPPRLHAPLFF